MRILHVITGLGKGGAENTLYKVCKHDLKNQHIVISLKGRGKYYSLLKCNHKIFVLFKTLFPLEPKSNRDP